MALILVGQNEFWDRLKPQSYAAIRQRIDLQYKLPHLDRSQVGEYAKRHLAYAGAQHDIISDNAVDEISSFPAEPREWQLCQQVRQLLDNIRRLSTDIMGQQ